MTFDDLFEPSPDPIAWLVNISKHTNPGTISERIAHWGRRSTKNAYIGRGSIWGNPYSHLVGSSAEFQVHSRDEAIEKYREYILENPTLLSQIGDLRGMVLGCWCSPLRCHGEVLLELLDECKL